MWITSRIETNSPCYIRTLFKWCFVISLLLKMMLAVVIPLTGDEALFYQWGQHLAWGYYDHPPMVGWWLALVSQAGNAVWWLRLLTVVSTHVVVLGMINLYEHLYPQDNSSKKWWMGMFYLLMPWSLLFVLVTTDTPLFLFSSLSVWFFVRAVTKQKQIYFFLAGLFVGLAFLSKYFVVLLLLAYCFCLWRFYSKPWKALIYLLLPVIFFGVENLWFNLMNGWPNVMFNVFHRNEGVEGHSWSWLVFLLMMMYVLSPWLCWEIKKYFSLRFSFSGLMTALWAVPFFVFLLVSFRREVGLHWVLSFVPIFVLWVALMLPETAWPRLVRLTCFFSLGHVLMILTIVFLPLSWISSASLREKLTFLRHAEEFTQQLSQGLSHKESAILMGESYSTAAVVAYHYQRYVPIFGVGSKYARQDDLMTDFREFDGKTIRIFSRASMSLTAYEPFFRRVSLHHFVVRGIPYYYVDGEGFLFEPYRQHVLTNIKDKYFKIPSFLPVRKNPFCDRYGFESCVGHT
jgi:hypothetical protein